MPSRQRFQRSKSSGSKGSKESKECAPDFDALESVAKPPTPAVHRFNVLYARKSRSSIGNNSGVLYLTATSAVLYAHFVNVALDDERVVMPFKDMAHVRKISYRLLIQQGLLLRCHGLPDYLIMPCKKSDLQQVKDLMNAMAAELRGSATTSSDAMSSTDTPSIGHNCETDSDSPCVDFKDFVSADTKESADQQDVAARNLAFDPPQYRLEDEIHPNTSHDIISSKTNSPYQQTSKSLIAKFPALRKVKHTFFQLITHDTAYLLIICLFLILISVSMCISLYQLRTRISSLARVIKEQ